MTEEEKFADVMREIGRIIEDLRVNLDLMTLETAAWAEGGLAYCGEAVDVIGKAEESVRALYYLVQFHSLASTYHALHEHRKDIGPLLEAVLEEQVVRLESLFARFHANRIAHESAHETAAPDAKDSQGWLDRLMQGFGKKAD